MTNLTLLHLIREEYYKIQPQGCDDFFEKRDKRIPCLQRLQKRFGKTYDEILIMAGVRNDIKDNEDFLRALEEFPYELCGIGPRDKVKGMVIILNDLYKKLKSELSGMFTMEEVMVISVVTVIACSQIKPICNKSALIKSIENKDNGILEEIYGVDKVKLLSKLEKLTEVQAFIVIEMVYEYQEYRFNHQEDGEEVIRKIFML